MEAIRLNIVSEVDGRLILNNVPVKTGENVEVIILKTDNHDETSKTIEHSFVHDKAWQFLKEEDDLYSDSDCAVRLK